jgi:hypothetical protein
MGRCVVRRRRGDCKEADSDAGINRICHVEDKAHRALRQAVQATRVNYYPGTAAWWVDAVTSLGIVWFVVLRDGAIDVYLAP